MILPTKHIRLSESLIGLGGVLLNYLNEPLTIDALWQNFDKRNMTKYSTYHNFDNLVLAVNLLFLMGIVNINDKGELVKCD